VGIQTLSAEVSGLKTEIEQKLNVNVNLDVNLNVNDPVLEQLSMVRVEIAAMSPTVTHCHIIRKLFRLRSIFLTMLSELRSVLLVLSCPIEFVSIHYPISLRSKSNSFRSDRKRLSRHSGLSFS
jgi:hypothetical protein